MKKYAVCTRLLVLCLCVAAFALTGCSKKTTYRDSGLLMDTMFSVQITVDEGVEDVINDPAEEILVLGQQLEHQISWRESTSELAAINEAGVSKEGYELSPKMAEWLEVCLALSEASDGAFDITIGNMARLWNIDAWAKLEEDTFVQLPSEDRVREELRKVGYSQVHLAGQSIQMEGDVSLDLGAVGKGIFLQEAYALPQVQASENTMLVAGGSILVKGQKEDGSSWNIGVVDPFDTAKVWGTLSLKGDYYVSTSGDYERYVIVDGVRFHHIIDPRTGYPVRNGVRSVSIVIDAQTENGGLLSDALSTACFVLGPAEGMELAKQYGAEVLYIMEDGSSPMTEGMRALLR